MSDINLIEMLSLGAKASIGRHVTRSLSATAKRLKKEKKKERDFILDSLTKGEIKWAALKKE